MYVHSVFYALEVYGSTKYMNWQFVIYNKKDESIKLNCEGINPRFPWGMASLGLVWV